MILCQSCCVVWFPGLSHSLCFYFQSLSRISKDLKTSTVHRLSPLWNAYTCISLSSIPSPCCPVEPHFRDSFVSFPPILLNSTRQSLLSAFTECLLDVVVFKFHPLNNPTSTSDLAFLIWRKPATALWLVPDHTSPCRSVHSMLLIPFGLAVPVLEFEIIL